MYLYSKIRSYQIYMKLFLVFKLYTYCDKCMSGIILYLIKYFKTEWYKSATTICRELNSLD